MSVVGFWVAEFGWGCKVFGKNKLNKPELRLSQRHRKSQGSKPVKTRTNMYDFGAIKCCLIQGSGSRPGLEPAGTVWDWMRGGQEQWYWKALESHHLPFISCVCICVVTQSCLTFCDPMDCSPPGSSVHGISQARILEWGCHFLLQGVFLTQGLNLGLLHHRQMLYPLSHQGSPFIS